MTMIKYFSKSHCLIIFYFKLNKYANKLKLLFNKKTQESITFETAETCDPASAVPEIGKVAVALFI